MCGRYAITLPPEAMRQLFAIRGGIPAFALRFNAAPTMDLPVVRMGDVGREIALLRWGLVPSWAKSLDGGSLLINARSETAAEKPSFRGAFARRRALVPANGFYEWQARGKGPKVPHFVHRRDGAPMVFAALWERWGPPEGGAIETFAILTSEANSDIAAIHHRMPVILPPEQWDLWLSPSTALGALEALLTPAPLGLVSAYPVSLRVNSVANDDPALLAPAEAPPEGEAQAVPAPRRPGQLDLF
ncbi:MAG: SOS response-associated peptidase [Alphaproteobacteria bacterium]|nr:SOS response-associated peptidase [Alphaproteobacteria bacterium]